MTSSSQCSGEFNNWKGTRAIFSYDNNFLFNSMWHFRVPCACSVSHETIRLRHTEKIMNLEISEFLDSLILHFILKLLCIIYLNKNNKLC